MTEAELQALVTEALDLGGWRWVHFRPARTKRGWRTPLSGSPGWPDVFAARDGVALALECKSEKGTVHVEQVVWLEELGKVSGVRSVVVRPENVDDVVRVILSRRKRTARP